MRRLAPARLEIAGREVELKVWHLAVGTVTLLLLDSDVPGNSEADRRITYRLYGGGIPDVEDGIDHHVGASCRHQQVTVGVAPRADAGHADDDGVFGETGVPVVNVYNACATGSAAIRMAYNSVAAGQTDTTMAVGADVSPKGFFAAKTDNAVQDRDVIRWKMGGLPNPIYWALECRKRMAKYGTTEEDLALVKVVMSEYGSKNPDARFKKAYTDRQAGGANRNNAPTRKP